MTDGADSDEGSVQWAYIFNNFGEEVTREMLVDVIGSLLDDDEPDRRVIEFSAGESIKAMDITEHVDELEERIEMTPDDTYDIEP